METLRLHHVTKRGNCPRIAVHGFRDSIRSVGTGVFMSPPGRLWSAGGFGELDFDILNEDEVVFAFDVPADVASEYALYESVDESEWLEGEPMPAGWFLYEYIIPAEVANRYCVGIVHPV